MCKLNKKEIKKISTIDLDSCINFRNERTIRATERNITEIYNKLNEVIEVINNL